ncbi:cannabinoid receptor type 1A [Nematostella vectensis]|uniref:cannabinoid receptor type 1A n=1 Tax=Nematostella vectensis TaxID=45351 RepID=UPI0020774CBB|nr:cannabinoid receptor type 1A [Nematostella vectensis]
MVANKTLAMGEDYIQCAVSNLMTWNPSFTGLGTKISSISATVVNFLTLPWTAALNVVVLKALLTVPTLRVRKSNIALSLLAVTDFLSGVTSQPLFLAREVTHLTAYGPLCTLENSIHFCVYVFSGSSLYHLLIVTYDRFVAITRPYEYPQLVTKRRLSHASLLSWIINIINAVIRYSCPSDEKLTFWMNIFSLSNIFVFTWVIVYWNSRILLEVRRQKIQMKTQAVAVADVKTKQKENKAAKTAIILLGALMVTYAPALALVPTFLLKPSLLKSELVFSFIAWVETFMLLNSLTNPLIYCLRSRELRHHMARKFKWVRLVAGADPTSQAPSRPQSGKRHHGGLSKTAN